MQKDSKEQLAKKLLEDFGIELKAKDMPVPGVQYRLIGGPAEVCILNGNSWEESQIKE